MKLWADGKNGSAGSAIHATIKEQVSEVNRKVISRGVRAVNAIRNAELEVLKGQRSGKVYRKPFTKHATYTASVPCTMFTPKQISTLNLGHIKGGCWFFHY